MTRSYRTLRGLIAPALMRTPLSVIAFLLCPALAAAEPDIVYQQKVVPVDVQSELRSNAGGTEVTVFSATVSAQDAPWVRVLFKSAALTGASYIRITSLKDGAVQVLDREALKDWGNSSAYFNGPAVQVELVAGPGSAGNSFSIDRLLAGTNEPPLLIQNVCGAETRRPSANPATARVLISRDDTTGVGGGSAFIIDRVPAGDPDNRCMLSAGHNFLKGNNAPKPKPVTVVQFNVPLSTLTCGLVNPGPDDQYPICQVRARNGTAQGFGGGDDWAVLVAGRNGANPRRTVFQRQNAAFSLQDPVDDRTTRVWGYGSMGITDPCTCNPAESNMVNPWLGLRNDQEQTQKTAVGRLTVVQNLGDVANMKIQVTHTVNTCGGNSGGPVTADSSGSDTMRVVAIHTTGNCNGATNLNGGTGVNTTDLVATIDSCVNGTLPPVVPATNSALLAGLIAALAMIGAWFLGRSGWMSSEKSALS